MQADAIPDWFIYIALSPIMPLTGVVHYFLGWLQLSVIVLAAVWRMTRARKHVDSDLRLFLTVYIPFLILPNMVVVAWAIWNDTAL